VPSRLSRFTLALLSLALLLSGVLAYQAQDAARSHRDRAERTLREYAAFIAWEVGTNAHQDLLATHYTAFTAVNRTLANAPASARLDADTLAALIRSQEELCECTGGARYFFAIDFRDSTVSFAGDSLPPDAGRREVVDVVSRVSRTVLGPPPPTPIVVRSREGTMRAFGTQVTSFSAASVFEEIGGRPTAIVYLVPRTADGRQLAAYGFGIAPRTYVGGVFSGILSKRRLLPPVVLRGAPADSLIELTVTDPAGRLVYRSPVGFPATYSAEEVLDPRFGALHVSAALNPMLAERLLIGGLPRSRLPVLLALFGLTAGLVIVALVQIRRQQELARLRTDFVSGVSHELRTPLAQIRLLAELLHMGRPESEDGRRRSARIIDQEARRLSYLVENILTFSRSERGGTRLVRAPIDLATAAAETVEMFAPLAVAAGSSVELEAEEGVHGVVDHAALRQVLLNLLDNANRYGPRGQRIVVGVARTGEVARVWVDDEGRGVPGGERQRVWEPYYRMDRDAAVTAGGSGIGLAVVRDLVQRHGGRVWIEDGARGRGARVIVELPAAPPRAVPAPPWSVSDARSAAAAVPRASSHGR
jgi:signal transduction histidine kinase